MKERAEKLEAYFNGTKIPSAKIGDISVDRLTTGNLGAVANVGGGTNDSVIIDGENTRIIIKIAGVDQILIGKQIGGF